MRAYAGNPFQTIEVYNTSVADITISIFYGFGEFIDNSKVFSVTGNINCTQVDNNFATPSTIRRTVLTCTGGNDVLIAADASRGEVWLWTDEPNNLAYWAESAAVLGAGTDGSMQIGLNLDGFTKIKTKAAIWAKAAIGVKVTALEFRA